MEPTQEGDLIAEAKTPPVAGDYTGVATRELKAIFDARQDVDIDIFADRIGMDQRDLKKVVGDEPKSVWIGLRNADRILLGLGLTMGDVTLNGVFDEVSKTLLPLHVIPAGNHTAAKRFAADEFYCKAGVENTATPQQIAARAEGLRALRAQVLAG